MIMHFQDPLSFLKGEEAGVTAEVLRTAGLGGVVG